MSSEIIDDNTYIINRIIDNSNQLVLEVIYAHDDSFAFVETYTVSGETLTLKQEDSNGAETFPFTKYNQNVDDLTICDN